MKNYTLRFFSVLLTAVCIVSFLMCFETTGAYAAFNSRSLKGARKMPKSGVMKIPAGKAVKINFGKRYHPVKFYYFKIKPKKTGIITFRNDYTRGNRVALCNAKKKVISKGHKKYDDYYSSKSVYKYQRVVHYGVKKGRTYYIRVRGSSGKRRAAGKSYVGSVKWTNKRVSRSRYGTKKKKAKTIKKKKTVKGLFVAGKKKPQWYKIKTRKKKTVIKFKAKKSNGTLNMKVYYKSRGKWHKRSFPVYRNSKKNVIIVTSSKKKKHKYYLKVYPNNKTSGSYTIKWK